MRLSRAESASVPIRDRPSSRITFGKILRCHVSGSEGFSVGSLRSAGMCLRISFTLSVARIRFLGKSVLKRTDWFIAYSIACSSVRSCSARSSFVCRGVSDFKFVTSIISITLCSSEVARLCLRAEKKSKDPHRWAELIESPRSSLLIDGRNATLVGGRLYILARCFNWGGSRQMLHGSGGGGFIGCVFISEGYWRGGFAPAWAIIPTLRNRDNLIVVCLSSAFAS